eukprot:5523509-Pleurochrysis_carterae.AAC.1
MSPALTRVGASARRRSCSLAETRVRMQTSHRILCLFEPAQLQAPETSQTDSVTVMGKAKMPTPTKVKPTPAPTPRKNPEELAAARAARNALQQQKRQRHRLTKKTVDANDEKKGRAAGSESDAGGEPSGNDWAEVPCDVFDKPPFYDSLAAAPSLAVS